MSVSTITIAGQTINLVALPTDPPAPALIDWSMEDAVGIVRSEFGGRTQGQEWRGGDLWSGRVRMPTLSAAQTDAWISFIEECRGEANAFQMGDPLRMSAKGSASGAPFADNTLNGGNPAGSQSLGTSGWTPNAAGVLAVGDYLQVGFRLYKVLDDVNADASGQAIFPIWPSLREQPFSDGAPGWVLANGSIRFSASRPLGQVVAGAVWMAFAPSVALPEDAVIQGVYPVVVLSANHDLAWQYLEYGAGLNLSPSFSRGHPFEHPFGGSTGMPQTTIASTLCYAESIGASLDLAESLEIRALLNTTLFADGLTDTMTITAVGAAVYYASAAPVTDTAMPAPFPVPAGQGLAWAMPGSVTQTGVFGYGYGLGFAAISKTPITYRPRGLWRLAANRRSILADTARYGELTFSIREYR